MKISNTLFIGIVILSLLVGCVTGTIIGIQAGQNMLFEGVAIAMTGSNTNITINLNETELVNQANKTLIPELKKIFEKELGEMK